MLKIGHRGAPRIAPANTMAGFRLAADRGCGWVECDCRASKNGIVVLAHDPEVSDETGKRCCRVDQATADELAAFDLGAGEGVPTLFELAEWAADNGIGVVADVKVGGMEREIRDALAPLPSALKYVAGADERGRCRFRKLDPNLPLSLTVNRLQIVTLRNRLSTVDTEAVTLEYPIITPARIAALQARDIRVFAWTVDDLRTMHRLAAMGIDGIISNRPDLLAEL
jgi:glycerophosphoryl diester phosphodiesterase